MLVQGVYVYSNFNAYAVNNLVDAIEAIHLFAEFCPTIDYCFKFQMKSLCVKEIHRYERRLLTYIPAITMKATFTVSSYTHAYF